MALGDGFLHTQTINTGLYISTTNVWDLGVINDIDVTKPEFKELLVRLYQSINNIALSLNQKDSGIYPLMQFVTGQQFFSTQTSDTQEDIQYRGVFRLVVNVGTLGSGATTVAHSLPIDDTWSFTRIYGAASDQVGFNYYPLPWASAAGATNIELKVNQTSVVITNNSGISFTQCYVVLEFLKN